jgi:large subunit ribosomal protein L33
VYQKILTNNRIVAKNKGARIRVILEHKCDQGVYRYHTTKNRRNTTNRLELKKYSPVTKRHELFREIK